MLLRLKLWFFAFGSWVFLFLLGGCYYHAMGGAALSGHAANESGPILTVSTGLNGPKGGVGMNLSGSHFARQASAMIGIEGFRLWRSVSQTGIQPYARGALGLLELGGHRSKLLVGGLSPRAEAGMVWLNSSLWGPTLSTAAEYRPRIDGLSTPVFWLQLGFGDFDFLQSTARSSRGQSLE